MWDNVAAYQRFMTMVNNKKIAFAGLFVIIVGAIIFLYGQVVFIRAALHHPDSTSTLSANLPVISHEEQPIKIGQLHLFGEASSLLTEENAKITTLAIHLVGILSISSDKEKGTAIIATEDGDEEMYFVGERIPGGAYLYRVEEKQVILMHNDQLETLKLPELQY